MGEFAFVRQGMANKHTIEQQKFIVRKLAAFEPPRSIVLDFMAVFTDKCDENDVRRLDPANGALPFELFTLFNTTRSTVLANPDSAEFAIQQARLIALSADVKFYRGNNQLPESRAVLRQIAEELGAVGGKGAAPKGGTTDSKPGEAVTEIVRKVVDPKAPEPAQVSP